jgi:CheY-like chemotaxis protein
MPMGAALASESAASAAQPAPAAAQAQSTAPLVLVAEDEDSLRGMLELALRGRGYRVLLCADGAAAREALAGDEPIKAALFDLKMPGVTGAELLRTIRSNPRRASIPAIAMSAYSDEQTAKQLLAAGADAFLMKPFTLQQLTATLDGLLRGAANP